MEFYSKDSTFCDLTLLSSYIIDVLFTRKERHTKLGGKTDGIRSEETTTIIPTTE